jgi:hypothetical protein
VEPAPAATENGSAVAPAADDAAPG